MIILNINDFSYDCSLLIKYTRLYNIKVSNLDLSTFNQYMTDNCNLNELNIYNISKIDTIKSTLNKNDIVYSNGTISFLEQLSKLIGVEITNKKSIEVLRLMLFSNPARFLNGNKLIIPLFDIHKCLYLCKYTNLYVDDHELDKILNSMNERFGFPLITNEDKQQFIKYLKAS